MLTMTNFQTSNYIHYHLPIQNLDLNKHTARAMMVNDKDKSLPFDILSHCFCKFHTNPVNVFLHLITTPLGIMCFIHLVFPENHQDTLAFAYCGFLLISTRRIILVALTGIALYGMLTLNAFLNMSTANALMGISLAYCFQDLAHWMTGEHTFQSTYEKDFEFFITFIQHNVYLLPLCISAAMEIELPLKMLQWFVPFDVVVKSKLSQKDILKQIAVIRSWIECQDLPLDLTTHWWYESLKGDVKVAFDSIVTSSQIMSIFQKRFPFSFWAIEPVLGMNEVYVASMSHKNNSDAVFYTNHVDGPFAVFPFANVYRCLVALNPNEKIKTVFPTLPDEVTLDTADFIGFDFNREVHRIDHNVSRENKEKYRMTLKLHYVIYPKVFRPYGKCLAWLTTQYDIVARQAFLQTLTPASFFDQLLVRFIMICTNTAFAVHKYIGPNTIAYVTLLWLLSFKWLNRPEVFVIGTSFIHYGIYIGTYYWRNEVHYGNFKRNAMVFKFISVSNLAYYYMKHFDIHFSSLLAILCGTFLSLWSAVVLGVDGTYFGAELSIIKNPIRAHKFPYGTIPHPMIVGNFIWLSGLLLMPGFKDNAPFYLVPTHMTLYFIHMIQEHFEICHSDVRMKSPTATTNDAIKTTTGES